MIGTAAIRALTIRQPWCEAVVDAHKPVENRSNGFPKIYRGLLLLHASKGWSARGQRDERIREHYDLAAFAAMARGAVIGVAELVDIHPAAGCCAPWGEETYQPANPEDRPPGRVTHLALEHPIPIAPVEARGALGLWRPDDDLLIEVAHRLADQVEWDRSGAAAVADRGDVTQLWHLLAEVART